MTSSSSFSCDSSWHRYGDGTTLVAGSPLAVFSLSEAGRDVARALELGATLPDFHQPLTTRLEAAGAIHHLAHPLSEPLDTLLTIIIPAYVRDERQREQLTQLVDVLSRCCSVIVVDDASPTPVRLASTRVIRHESNEGPASARNTGLAHVDTPFVAFVDSDVTSCEDAFPLLVATCAREGVGLVAPRVATTSEPSWIARYEERFSPLDLGTEPGRVAPGTRISYVPSAVWVARTDRVRSLGGFDQNLRVGEDVDFVWRLNRSGSSARYEPRAIVRHEPRRSLRDFIRQRYLYGTSVAPLSSRHPEDLRPLKASWHSVAIWAFLFAGLPIVSLALVLYTFIGLARRLRHLDNGVREAFRLVLRGHWSALASTARLFRREWVPVTLVGIAIGGRVGGVSLAVLVVPPIIDYIRGPKRLDPFRFVALRILDDASYGIGAVASCIRARTLRPLIPDLRSWRANVQ